MQDFSDNPPFAGLSGQIAALNEAPEAIAGPGHHDLGPDLWLSMDPGGRAVMGCAPGGAGFKLSLEAGESGAWACLGMRLPVETLRGGRYLGLLVAAESEVLISFTPTLRYFFEDGRVQDVATLVPVIMAGGTRDHLSYIPLDPDRLAVASGSELNLFFHIDGFVADFSRIEPLLIL